MSTLHILSTAIRSSVKEATSLCGEKLCTKGNIAGKFSLNHVILLILSPTDIHIVWEPCLCNMFTGLVCGILWIVDVLRGLVIKTILSQLVV